MSAANKIENDDTASELDFDNMPINKDAKWQEQHSKILIDWADKAMCYRWLHNKCTHKYTLANAWFTIPVIVISTLTGVGNFAQERVPEDYRPWFTMVIGAFNIVAGIVTTIQQFLKITEQMEGHRVSSIAWGKFYRNIKVELAKAPDERLPVMQMMKISKEEFDRLMETSPDIDEDVISLFKSQFKASDEFALISKPEICDELRSISKFAFVEKPTIFSNKEIEKMRQKKELHKNTTQIDDYKIQYVNIHGREPTDDDIHDKFDSVLGEEAVAKVIQNKVISNQVNVNVIT